MINTVANSIDEKIATLAYKLWVKRGRPRGYDSEIWREAQRQLQRFITKSHGCRAHSQ